MKKEREYDEEGRVIRTNKEAEKRLREEIKGFVTFLLKLPTEQYNALQIDETLLAELKEGKRLEGNALRRHLSYLVRLVHQQGYETIQKASEQVNHPYRNDPQKIHEVEQLHDRLIADDKTVIDEILTKYQSVDLQHLRQLARNAKKEQQKISAAQTIPSDDTTKKTSRGRPRNSKLLYQYLFKLPLR